MPNVFATVLVSGVLMAAGARAGEESLARLLPAAVEGYEPRGEDGVFDHDTVFQLINGGAEVYRALNLKKVISRRYGKDGSPDVIADIFDMGSAQDAFGAYRNDMREGPGAGVGQESEHLGSSLYFWKDRYFVSVVALRDDAVSRQAVLAIGRRIAQAIPREGSKPALLRSLPARGLVPSQVHYFHDWPSLNRRFFLADENLLQLDHETEGILARYRPGVVVVVVRYPARDRAGRAHSAFLLRYLPDAERGVARTENGKWTAVRRAGRTFVGVFDAPTREDAVGLAGKVAEKSREP